MNEQAVPVYVSAEEIAELLEDLPGGQSVSATTRRLYRELHDARRRGARVLLAAGVPEQHDEDIIHGPLLPVRQQPDMEPQRFYLICKHDITGSTGVGFIAEGCRFSDGAVVIRRPKTSGGEPGWRFYDGPATEAVLKGDWGVNVIDVVWLDVDEPR